MEETNKRYFQEYSAFLEEYKKGFTDGERIGEMIARFAQYFAMSNADMANAIMAFDKVSATIEQSTDGTGKAISSAKAKVLAAATPESQALTETKARVENIDQMINALKSFQKGVMAEFKHGGIA